MDEIVGAKGILTEPSPQENDMTPIRKIGIIGSGQMGNGIAHVIALAGYDVVGVSIHTSNDAGKEWTYDVMTGTPRQTN